MTKGELFYQLRDVADNVPIYMESSDGSVGDFQVEPVTVSCDDPTVMGYMIVAKEVEH